jgi:hypothetical protein
MNVRGLWVSIALATVARPLAEADDRAEKRVPAQQPVQVTCEVIEIWASTGKTPAMDPALGKQLQKRLTSAFGSKWNDYKQLSSNPVTLTKKTPQKLKLKKGSATVTLVEVVDKDKVRLTAEFIAANGKSGNLQQLVAAGDWVMTAVQQGKEPSADGHLLAVGCK